MLAKFWHELIKRNIHKAALSYVAVMWLILQACSILLPLFSISADVQRRLVFGMIVLFPFWLVFAWYYEYTKNGFVRTEVLPDDSEVFQQTNKRLNMVIISVLSAAVILLLADRLFNLSGAIGFSDNNLSIAVLPFDNLSGDDQQTYYAAGMQDELIGHLAKLSNLRVISRTSTLKYAGAGINIPAISDELQADLIVEGSLLKYGDSVRIQLQLIDARDKEAHLWNRFYDRPVKNVLDMHSKVTKDIVESIKLVLSPSEKTTLSQPREVDPRAYDALLRGKFDMFKFTPQDIQLGLQYFYLARKMDPLNPFPLYSLTRILSMRGDSLGSFESWKNYNLTLGDTLMVKAMEAGYLKGGIKTGFIKAAEALEMRRKFSYVRPHLLVLTYDMAGETDEAISWLDSCLVYRDHDMVYAGASPYTEEFRAHPKFKKIVDKMNFPFDYLRIREEAKK